MEDNNQTAPAQNAQQQNASAAGGENKNRRRRGHRGGKKHQEKKQRAAAAAAAENVQKSEGAPQKSEKTADTASKNNQNNSQNNSQNNHKKNDNRKHHHHHQKDGKKQPDRLPQKDDVYGNPREERELAEWRAKIVLNAPEASVATPTNETEPEEPMPELSNEELFASPASTATPVEANEEKVEVIGIRFRSAGKVYYFDPRGQKLKKGDFAIVETARGPEFGEVNLENTMVNVSETVTPLRPLIRVATPADVEHNAENREKEKNALIVCQQKIEAHKLDMKLIDVQYAFDNSKLLFYFSSDGRVLSSVKSVFVTKQKCLAVSVPAVVCSVAALSCPTSRRFPSKWQRNKVFLSTPQKFRACVADSCVACTSNPKPTPKKFVAHLPLTPKSKPRTALARLSPSILWQAPFALS